MYQLRLLLCYKLAVFRLGMYEQLALDVIDRFIQCVAEFFEIFLVEENLMFLIFLFPDPLALSNRDVKVLF